MVWPHIQSVPGQSIIVNMIVKLQCAYNIWSPFVHFFCCCPFISQLFCCAINCKMSYVLWIWKTKTSLSGYITLHTVCQYNNNVIVIFIIRHSAILMAMSFSSTCIDNVTSCSTKSEKIHILRTFLSCERERKSKINNNKRYYEIELNGKTRELVFQEAGDRFFFFLLILWFFSTIEEFVFETGMGPS